MPIRLRHRLLQVALHCAFLLGVAMRATGPEHPGRLPFAILGPDQGLPSGSVVCMAQDRDGFIWFGSENGLFRYEGGRSRHWTTAEGLPSAFVTALVPAAGGGLWVSTLRGLVHLRGGRIETPYLNGKALAGASYVIAEDAHGRLWVAHGRGLYRQRADLSFEALPFSPSGGIRALVQGPHSGAVLVCWEGGVTAIDAQAGIRTWSTADGFPAGGSTMIAEDGAGRLWAAAGRTLRMRPPGGARFLDRSALVRGSFSPNGSAYLDTDGSVWFPTQDGALHLSGDRADHLDASRGLPFRWLRTLLRDRENTLWALGPGVARVLGGGRLRTYSLTRSASGEIVWTTLRRRDGTLVAGTDDGAAVLGAAGLIRIAGTEGARIKTLAEDAEGTLWLGGTTGPVLWLRPGANRAAVAPLDDGARGINALLRDADGHILIGHTRSGLLRWNPASRRLVAELRPEDLQVPALGVFDVAQDPAGRLWAATTAGLLARGADGHWARGTTREGLRHDSVHSVAPQPDGSTWIAYLEPAGLSRVRWSGGRLQVLEHRTRKEGLNSDAVYALHTTPSGALWIGTDQGVERLQPPLHLGLHDGMPSEDCALHGLRMDGRQLWIGTVGGLVRYEPGAETEPPPAACLLEASFGATVLQAPLPALAPLAHREGTAQFRFSAPAYLNERALRFQVRLAGFEEAWREVDARVVRFPRLPGGRYRFEVRAARGDGAYGAIAGYGFEIRPPWYRTLWAYGALAVGLVGAVLAVVRLRVASLAHSKALLEAEVARRTEELRGRNAELSAALGKVRQLSGLLPICAHCKKIRDDHGYWNQLEHYISEHSEADFSHGLCPDCIPLLFPDLPRDETPEGPAGGAPTASAKA